MADARPVLQSRRFEVDPFQWTWRLLTSVRFALALIGFLALVSLLGVLIPQIPTQMRGNPDAMAGWLALQESRFGVLAEPMYQLGFFDVFRSLWFIAGLGLLVMSVTVCTANRFSPIWRNVKHPHARVPDEFFERGQPTIEIAANDIDALVGQLQKRRYRVTVSRESDATYLFADRFPWSQLATFVSHLALILFLAGGFVTIVTARDLDILIAEGETRPVFSPRDADHMQIYVEDAIGRFDDTGFPLDYRTELVVYKGGEEVARGFSTVNDPLRYDGYKFHQTAYFPDGAQLQVRDTATGRLVYDEVLALTDRTATPRIVIKDAAGVVLLDEVIIPTDFIASASGSVVPVPGTARSFWIGTRPDSAGTAWELVIFEAGTQTTAADVIKQGDSGTFGDVSVMFAGLTDIASGTVDEMPGASGQTIVEMANGPQGTALLITPLGGLAVGLTEGRPEVVGDFEYTFLGQREFAGITVRRDPGSLLIWIATGLLLLGLALTFYVPRRRLWAKIQNGGAAFRGLGGRTASIEKELRQLQSKSD